jgi:hypothetical protein
MPYIDGFDLEVDEFLNSCSGKDLRNIITYLIDTGLIKDEQIVKKERGRISTPEQMFNTYLNALNGKWNRLTTEEEDSIVKIAKKFV